MHRLDARINVIDVTSDITLKMQFSVNYSTHSDNTESCCTDRIAAIILIGISFCIDMSPDSAVVGDIFLPAKSCSEVQAKIKLPNKTSKWRDY
ncbi:hypothetical protein KPH14_001637 [Odynerus spinipes]|uniref:Uncharacterized protein n=1 Tax=Odynerus spinipes TaxID=1348599 RepID=A0AAD9VVQ4_9HYME|nr:hypothetical protein KPH14_001637 [Odynerus spinipes]